MKKNLLTFLFFAVSSFSFAQVPQGINYQAIARDNSGNPLQNTALQVKLAVKADSSWIGTVIWEEIHNPVTTNDFGLFTVVLGKGARQASSTVASFNLIDWNVTPKFLRTEIYYGGSWKQMGISRLQSVPYSMFSAKAESLTPGAKVVSTNDATSDALFEVKRKDGQTVFAVYPDAVNIYVPSGSKGTKGGFAIGGFGDKAPSRDYFRVTPDSVRIYIDNSPSTKGTKGGFAIGGFDGSKGTLLKNYYMNVSGTSTLDTVKGSPQILWFPNRNAFLAGNVWIGLPDSVGLYSTALGYRSIAMGDYSQAFGYKAKALGNYSTSIGKNSVAGAGKTLAMNAFAFGDGAKATGSDSYAFGSGATATGYRSFAFGSVGLDNAGNTTTTPTTASGDFAVAIGMGAQATQKGAMALGIGSNSSGFYSNSFGYYSSSTGYYTTAIGYQSTAAGNYSAAIGHTASSGGAYSTAIGYGASAPANYSLALGMGASTGTGTTLGAYATAIGYYSRAYGSKSTAIGAQYSTTTYRLSCNRLTGLCMFVPMVINKYNVAEGEYSVAIGNGNYSINGGITFGSANSANARGAIAIGFSNVADSAYSVAIGANNNATGYNAFAFGESLTAQAANSFVIGTYNVPAGSKTSWVNNDPLFVIGNGDSNTPHNALEVKKSGALYVYPDSSIYGIYNYATNTTYGLYIYNYAQNYTTSSIYGIRSYTYQNNSTATGYVSSGYFTSDNNGTGTNYGLRSYSYQNNTASTASVYSGYYFSSNAGSGANYGLYANIRSGGSIDIAEYIHDSHGDTQSGDVVVADPARKESVVKSSKPYQTGIVGVISTNPHLTMGMELIIDEKTGEEKKGVNAARLALTGRVPVNVTGENGPIQPGDYLTSSSTPGYAMKWTLLDVNEAKDFEDLKRILAENEKRRGAIIGKALENFSGTGTGKIMVLISLQ
ncbi:MAG TPA: hypothetical protein PK064_04585 [Bacteroidales bacterium]|nr:hypothetical protein [Bacteroidales bacterium]